MKFNITENSYQLIVEVIEGIASIQEALVFGSRAKGNSKKGSDIDIAIKGENLNLDDVTKLSALLNEEFPLPYFFDIVDYDSIKNVELKEHIDRVGQKIFSRNSIH